VIYNTPVLLWIKKLSSLIYRKLFYVNVHGNYKLLTRSSVNAEEPCEHTVTGLPVVLIFLKF